MERYESLNKISRYLSPKYPEIIDNPLLSVILGRKPRQLKPKVLEEHSSYKIIDSRTPKPVLYLESRDFYDAAVECAKYTTHNEAKGAERFAELMIYAQLYWDDMNKHTQNPSVRMRNEFYKRVRHHYNATLEKEREARDNLVGRNLSH